jgi:hypothetical protein
VNKKELARLKRERAERDGLNKDELGAIKDELVEILADLRLPKVEIERLTQFADLVPILTELADLQTREIEYLTEFRRELERINVHCPEQLENLSFISSMAEYKPFMKKLVADQTPTQRYESKRRMVLWKTVGKIEWEFGGAKQAPTLFGAIHPRAELGKSAFAAGIVFSPTCLDNIFAGGVINMLELQQLFGMDRNRFPRKLPCVKKGNQTLYIYEAITKIMDALLSEDPTERKRGAPGRRRQLWLGDPDLRTRVLSGIETRLNNISTSEHIMAAFLAVVHRHLPDSAKK